MSAPTSTRRKTVAIRFSTGGHSQVTTSEEGAAELVAKVAEAIDRGHISLRIGDENGATVINTRFVVLAEIVQ